MQATAVPSRPTERSGRFRRHGLLHEWRVVGGQYRLHVCVRRVWRMVMTQELPHVGGHETGHGRACDCQACRAVSYVADPRQGVCDGCGRIHAELMQSARPPHGCSDPERMRPADQPCGECRLERFDAWVEDLREELGVEGLGYGHRTDPVHQRAVYGYRDPITYGMRDAW